MNRVGFDNEKYLDEQSEFIIKRAKKFQNKLYLEFGGKLVFDYHASRILPGFDPNVKIRLLQRLRDRAEIILCIYAGDIERKKVRADFGITYDTDMLRLIDDLREWGLSVAGVVITRFSEQPAAIQFKNRLDRRGVRTYIHRATKGYPTDVDVIASDEGYGANPYIETTKPIVVVSAPGPGSGKMGTCLSQLYHDHKRGLASGYSKFETFPIWNLPLKHPVNIAYEAATADLGDFNMVDSFHLEAHGEASVNYNRDVEIFPVLKRILERITGEESIYQSPTDMGVNRAGFAIVDDEAVREASIQEIIRRYFRYRCEYVLGSADRKTVERAELLLKEVGAEPEARAVVIPAREAAAKAMDSDKGRDSIFCGAALQLADDRMVTGCNSPLMHAASSMLLNALKELASLPDEMDLLSSSVIDSVRHLKLDLLNGKTPSLDLEETLIALSVSAAVNPAAQLAMEKLPQLRGCEVHLSHIPSPGDEAGLRRLGVNVTSDPDFAGHNLFLT
ncbi:MAG: DUF1846 domain-containing protein [Kiritimatiellales bacterium]|nr:DUF1846 domain-containing protein [Kiritimatiellales bacterium]